MQQNNVYGELVHAIKDLVKQTVKSTQPMDVVFGTVTSTNPLQIMINQKMVLSDEFLILTSAVRDHTVPVSMEWETEETKCETMHKHEIQGRKKITIHNGLTRGEKVLLLRAQGGQNYIVIDRVDEIPTGEGT